MITKKVFLTGTNERIFRSFEGTSRRTAQPWEKWRLSEGWRMQEEIWSRKESAREENTLRYAGKAQTGAKWSEEPTKKLNGWIQQLLG